MVRNKVIFFLLCFFSTLYAQKNTMAVVYPLNGKGDKSYADAAWEGVEKVRAEFKIDVIEIEPMDPSHREKLMEKHIKNGVKYFVIVDYSAQSQIEKMSQKYENVYFTILDAKVDSKNVKSVFFDTFESSFLAGFLACSASSTQKVGYISAMPADILKTFEDGFVLGNKKNSKKCDVSLNYITQNINDFTGYNNPSEAKKIARKLYSQNYDIIYHVSGASGEGVFQAALEGQKKVIGVDVDQSYLAPQLTLTSVLKRIDEVILLLAREVLKENFKSGTMVLGIKDHGVGVVWGDLQKKMIVQKDIDIFEQMLKKMKNGELDLKKEKK